MLTHLHIQNYALIGDLDIDFHSGFSVITGETGAGKSIILGALALVMGGRADAKTITEGEQHCVIEAVFESEKEWIIRRELNNNGRSRSFVNDEVVSQAELKALARQLIDIHSQHENLLLSDDLFQLSVIDAIAGNATEREVYSTCYNAYCEADKSLRTLKENARKAQADADYIRFQYRQLEEAHLASGEADELEQEIYRLSHAEEIKAALYDAAERLDGEEQGALSLIRGARLEQVSGELAERLRSVEIELQDIANEASRIAEKTEFDPERLQTAEERLGTLNNLLKKHGVQTIDELIAVRDRLGEQCHRMESYDEDIQRLEAECSQRLAALRTAATALTQSRRAVRQTISEQLTEDLGHLGVAHAHVDIDITPLDDFAETGADNVQFLFAANLNQSLRRAAEVASGGEISRLMLCIKALIASTNGLPTIIFDEIDTGVSGSVASRMGGIMCRMAESRQIIAITHLPQIASKGTTQYKVYKYDTDRRTETHIKQLTPEERVVEIARILSGENPTPSALQTARQLLDVNTDLS